MRQILDFLVGKKTYIMIVVDALDQLGVALGWWEEARIREIFEAALTLGFLRAGVNSSAPVPVSFISKGLLKSVPLVLLAAFGLTACATYHDAGNGRYNVTKTTQEPSLFGTNMGFARIENCARPQPDYYPAVFTDCNPVTGWTPMYSQGQGGQVVGGALTGLGFGLGSAFGSSSGASAISSSEATAISGGGKH
jgi:hypothetical protein